MHKKRQPGSATGRPAAISRPLALAWSSARCWADAVLEHAAGRRAYDQGQG
jgi:hypothetical protein